MTLVHHQQVEECGIIHRLPLTDDVQIWKTASQIPQSLLEGGDGFFQWCVNLGQGGHPSLETVVLLIEETKKTVTELLCWKRTIKDHSNDAYDS